MESTEVEGVIMFMLRSLVFATFISAIGCATSSSATEEATTINLDDYRKMARERFIHTIRHLEGELVFVKGRIWITRLSYPDAPYVDERDGRVYPCENGPFNSFSNEDLDRESLAQDIGSNPWFLNTKFVSLNNGSAASVKMNINYKLHPPTKIVPLRELHGKCITLLVKVTGEIEITAIAAAGTLYIYNVYDTERSPDQYIE